MAQFYSMFNSNNNSNANDSKNTENNINDNKTQTENNTNKIEDETSSSKQESDQTRIDSEENDRTNDVTEINNKNPEATKANSDSKNSYRSKIKPSRHHHSHHHSQNLHGIQHTHSNHHHHHHNHIKHRIKKNSEHLKLNLNTSVSSSLTSNSSVSVLTGTSSSPSSTPTSSSPSLTSSSSSSSISSGPSSPSLSPNPELDQVQRMFSESEPSSSFSKIKKVANNKASLVANSIEEADDDSKLPPSSSTNADKLMSIETANNLINFSKLAGLSKLSQSLSVPKLGFGLPPSLLLSAPGSVAKKRPTTNDYNFYGSNPSLLGSAHPMNSSMGSLPSSSMASTSSASSATYVPPTGSSSASSEVKQRLKNMILLKKLDKQSGPNMPDMNNNNNNNNNNSSNSASSSGSGKVHNFMMDSNGAFAPNSKFFENAHLHNPQILAQFEQHSHLLNLFNNSAAKLELNAFQSKLPHNANLNVNMLENNSQLQMLKDLSDESNLRRTTSEPNLKVKSALKDRLLEKRNNPFLAVKRGDRVQQSPPVTGSKAYSSATTNGSSPFQPAVSNKNYLKSSSKPNLSPSSSMSKMPVLIAPNPINPHQQQQQQQQQLPSSLSLSSLPLQQQQQQHSAQDTNSILAAAAAAAAAVAAAAQQGTQQDLAATLKLALQQQLGLNELNNNNSALLESLALRAAQSSNLMLLNQSKQAKPNSYSSSSSLSFPMLPNPSYSSKFNKLKSDESKHESVMPKFGHTAHVEEENELLLENELKNAAKINDANAKSLYEYQPSANSMSVDDDEETLQESESRKQDAYNSQHRLERASSHYSYEQFAANFNRHSNPYSRLHNFQQNYPQLVDNYHYNQLLMQQQHQQQQLSQLSQLNQFRQHLNESSLDEAHKQLLLLQQKELEEQRLQQKYHSSKGSFFSDPHLLKSLKIASSNSNLNAANNVNNNNNPKNKPFELSKQSNNNNVVSSSTKKLLSNVIKGNSMLSKTSSSDQLNAHQKNMITPMECNAVENGSDERVYRYTTGIVYDKVMLKHECTCGNPANHLETPDRIKSIWSRFKYKDIDEECEIVTPKIAPISDLLTCHNEQYALIFGSDIESRPKLPNEYLQTYMMNVCLAPCQGFALAYDQDNSWNEEFTPIACRVAVGSTFELASLVSNGKLKNGFALVRPPGSHAEFNKPLGFCYFNTVAIVAKLLKKNLSLDRILIVDWDVHHGNGTQQMTYSDPNIMYMSLHRHDNGNFFPGTGSIQECGQEGALGKNINIAWNGKLNPAMGDAEYLAAFRSVVMPIAKAFKPQIVLVSSGFDGTEFHPKELGGFKLTPTCFAYMTKKLMSLAEGKVVLVLEGGYDLKSLCDCSEMCINALMDKQIPSFPRETLDAIPNANAIQDLENVIDIQSNLAFFVCLCFSV